MPEEMGRLRMLEVSTLIQWKGYPAGCPAYILEVTLHSYA